MPNNSVSVQLKNVFSISNMIKIKFYKYFKEFSLIQTVDYSEAAAHLRFNPYIMTGYRTPLSPYQCFQSLFIWTNETINIWTHLLGLCVFLGLLWYDLLTLMPDQNIVKPPCDIAVAVFILLCFIVCMLLSVLYHTLNCISAKASRRFLALDLLGISLAFYAVFFSGIFYGFWCPQHIVQRNVYIGLVTSVFICSLMFVFVPSLSGESWQRARLRLFAGWAASGVLPTLHWLYLHLQITHPILQVFLPRIVVMYLICGAALIVYVYKIPEKIYPGHFDRLGSSHQLWHVLIAVALLYWHQTGLLYARYRSAHACPTP